MSKTIQYSKEWRESLNGKYGIQKKSIELEEWKSYEKGIKEEIQVRIDEINKERKEDIKNLLNSFLEKKNFNQRFPIISQYYETKSVNFRKRKYYEI